MNVRVGESGVPSTRINITVSPTPLTQPPDDADGISDGLSAGLAAESNDLTGLSDSFSRADLNQHVVDDEVQSYPTTPDSDGVRTPGSSSVSATSTTTLRDGYIPPAPTPPQPRQRATTAQSRAEGAHVSSPTGYINNTRLGAFVHERGAPETPAARRASPVVQNHESDPSRPDHLLSTLQAQVSYLTPPHLHPKLHLLLDPAILAETDPAIFGIRLADVLLQVCAPRRDRMIIELVGKTCMRSGVENGGSGGGEVVMRR